ncbi:MAG: hypothetical protein LBE38_11120 [Deltaproteobacteria bacterium]|jgi:hypothetical protein|nr:hypothetical protein [Deltaproteobacteria bacterium]
MGSVDFNAIVANFRTEVGDEIKNFYFTPSIPEKKLRKAIENYAPLANPNDILVLYDNTLLGSATDGFMVAPNMLYVNSDSSNKVIIKPDEIKSIKCGGATININDRLILGWLTEKNENLIKSIYGLITGLLAVGDYGGIAPAPLVLDEDPPVNLPDLEAKFRTANLSFQHGVFFSPNIPQQSIINATQSYARNVNPSNIMVLFEADANGNGTMDRFLLTSDTIFANSGIDNKTAFFRRDMIRSLKIKMVRQAKETHAALLVNGYFTLALFLDVDSAKRVLELITGVLSLQAFCKSKIAYDRAVAALNPPKTKLKATMGYINYNVIIQNFLSEKAENSSSFYFSPNIPQNKLQNAIAAYAQGVAPSQVTMLFDATTFGKADDGFLIIPGYIFAHEPKNQPLILPSQQIKSIIKKPKNKIIINGYTISLGKIENPESLNSIYGLITGLLGWGGYSGPVPAPIIQGTDEPIDLRSLEAEFRASNVKNIEKYYFKPNIPQKKLANAIGKYAQNADPNDVLLLFDDTTFGSADQGFLLTSNCLYIHDYQNTKMAAFPRDQIHSLKFKNDKLLVNGYFKIPHFSISPNETYWRNVYGLIAGALVLGGILTPHPIFASDAAAMGAVDEGTPLMDEANRVKEEFQEEGSEDADISSDVSEEEFEMDDDSDFFSDEDFDLFGDGADFDLEDVGELISGILDLFS